MKYNKADESIRERLLVAGIKELENHGFNDFSLRRVANLCNVSCAAPYKHFKNKEELLFSLMDYLSSRWFFFRDQVMEIHANAPTKTQLIEVCTAYVRFLLATPSYMTILTMHPDRNELTEGMRGQISSPISDLIDELFEDKPQYDDIRNRTVYSVRAYIYGTVCMIRNKEVADVESTVATFRRVLAVMLNTAEGEAERIRKESL